MPLHYARVIRLGVLKRSVYSPVQQSEFIVFSFKFSKEYCLLVLLLAGFCLLPLATLLSACFLLWGYLVNKYHFLCYSH